MPAFPLCLRAETRPVGGLPNASIRLEWRMPAFPLHTAGMGVEIPLFELGVVLFPHMPLGLHVFEDRYRAMLRDCEEQGISFGVIAIREGIEVGGGTVAHEAGTLAQIRRVDKLDDGRANLLV